MSGVYLERLATDRASYLTARQSLVAQNVANVNTPGYRAVDLPTFDALLASRSTGAGTPGSAWAMSDALLESKVEIAPVEDADTLSGNSVPLEQQMATLAEINKSYALTTSLTRVFNQMFTMAAK